VVQGKCSDCRLWLQDDKPVKMSDRVKAVVKADDKDKAGFQFLLEITGPAKTDEGKYKWYVNLHSIYSILTNIPLQLNPIWM
jgi:hypothetical protein